MSDPTEAGEPLDPKEAMRQALERKKAHEGVPNADGPAGRGGGQPHGKAGAKRTFRRKSGG